MQWRKPTLAWLRAELAGWKKQIESEDAAAVKTALHMLAWSKQDPDLVGIRDEAGLALLSSDESRAWRAFWAEVDALLASRSRSG